MDKRMLAVLVTLLVGLLVYSNVLAQDDSASPVASPGRVQGPIHLVLVERDAVSRMLDVGAEGPSAGDVDNRGPNPFYDEMNTSETGITTQGTCTLLHDLSTCLALVTIAFQDGSLIVVQGIQTAPIIPRIRPIVGGSGQ